MTDLLAMLNPLLAHLLPGSPLSGLDDLQRRIDAYTDPLSPLELRTLIALRSTWYALHYQYRHEDYNYGIRDLVETLAQTGEFDYALRLMHLKEPHFHDYNWGFLAVEQAKAGRLDDALASLHHLRRIKDHDYIDVVEYFTGVAAELARHGDPRATAAVEKATTMLFEAYVPEEIFLGDGAERRMFRAYDQFAQAMTGAGQVDLALKAADLISYPDLWTETVCAIVETLIPVDLPRARQMIESAVKKWIYEERYYDGIRHIEAWCRLAQTVRRIDPGAALRLLKHAARLVEPHRTHWKRWLIAEGFAESGRMLAAFRILPRPDNLEERVRVVSDLAVSLSKQFPLLADRAFENALRWSDDVPPENHNRLYRTLADSRLASGRLEQALTLWSRLNVSLPDEYIPAMIEAGQIARLLRLRTDQARYPAGMEDIARCAVYVEKQQRGLWLACVQDMARIYGGIIPDWWSIYTMVTS